MKRFLLLLLVFAGLFAKGQVYNNEWIDYSKSYYKFKIRPDDVSKGLHRIPQSVLAANGLGSIPAEQFQLWRDGKQVPIYTSVQTGAMSSSDYIEFWGQQNNGKVDNPLYTLPDYQLSDKYSLFTDTAYYFLTVNAGVNLRLTPTTNNVAGNSLPVEPFFMYTAGVYFKAKVNQGYAAVVTEYLYSSAFDQGEGWTSNDLDSGQTLTTAVSGLAPYMGAGAPASRFKINAAGNSLQQTRHFSVKVNGTLVVDHKQMDLFDYVKLDVPLNISTISSGTASVDIIDQADTAPDHMVMAKYELIYPRQFNFSGARNFPFQLPANPLGNYLEISNFNYNFTTPVLYDLTNGRRYVADLSNPALAKFALLPSATTRDLVLVAEDVANVITVNTMQKRDFINYALSANQANYLIISHPLFATQVNDYKNYRNSVPGGSYKANVYMIDQLVDQFAFGIKQHPYSVRNFVRYARATYSSPLKAVFLVGRGMVYNFYRALESEPRTDELALVPTWGSPASDNTVGTEPGNAIPLTPVGRLSVIYPQEVTAYLNKVIEYEQAQEFSSPLIQDKAWMKNIAHVVGASDPVLQSILDSYMDHYSAMISDTLYGGNVNRFSKSSTDAVQQLSNQRMTNLFRDGMGILSYFGHSSATTLEFNLDEPTVYNNPGKYPLFIALGCNAGNFYTYNLTRFQQKTTISENFVLTPNRGAIAFMASTHFGIVHYLDILNTRFYNAIGNTKYGETLGEAQVEMIRQVFNLTTQNDYYAKFHCEQATIHGDPMIRLNTFPKPDYVIEAPLVKISPSFVSVADTKFNVDAKFLNIGRAINDSIVIETKRTYPDLSTEIVRRDTIPGIKYIDSLNFDLFIVPTRDKGLNKITITLDASNKVDELYETNNTITKDFFIYEDEARPVYPYDLAIMNKQGIKFKASTADPFSSQKQYTMELDTTELFNSPFKIAKTTGSTGGVIEFTPGITFTDSTVYYWRVAPVPTTGQPVWNKSSFIYLVNSDYGFNQSHLYQHFKSKLDRMRLDSTSRLWSYKDKTTNLFVRNGVFPNACGQATCLSVAVNGDPYIRSVCGQGGIIFHIFDPVTMKPWVNPFITNTTPGLYGSDPVCGITRIYNFQYNLLDTAKRRKIVELLDLIPNGYYVVVRNISSADPASNTYAADWANDVSYLGPGNSMYHRLKAQGFYNIDSFYKPRAFAFVYKKNDSGKFVGKSAFTDGIFDNLGLSADVPTPDTLGFMTSPVYGPARAWKQLKWRGSADSPNDLPTVDVIGIDVNGNESTLFSGLGTSQQDVDISSISALTYPNIKLRLRTLDSVIFTPYQMRYWRVTYTPVPEGALAPNIYVKLKDTVEVGEPIDFRVAFKNISDVPFDSLKVKLQITDRNNVVHIIPISRRRPIAAYNTPGTDTVNIATVIPTNNLAGLNTMYVEANPDGDQLEQYHFNNFAYHSIYVKPDSLSPLLDVTFDGIHILNHDIVASKPDIIVKLKDEARWQILDDTSLLLVQVRFPNGSIRRYFFAGNDTMKFNPAGQAPNTDNTASISFKPYFPVDGEYELIVSGKDKSENIAGTIQYRVKFQVINKPMISNMLNYPNPFTTSTAFVFTITGSEVPQNIKIEIMTITGKIVREITKNELGPLRVGRNITEFKWDGTDQYGQKLGNGIYLYRVVTNLNGKSLEKYKAEGDDTDKYFNKGYGKMVLIR